MPEAFALPALRLQAEREEPRDGAFERGLRAAQSHLLAAAGPARARRLRRILPLVEAHAGAFAAMDEAQLKAAAREFGQALRRAGDFPDVWVGQTNTKNHETTNRVLGKRHFDVQLLGAFAMVKGMLAEMATGEGKTLTATLAAGAVGLAGVPLQVVTGDD